MKENGGEGTCGKLPHALHKLWTLVTLRHCHIPDKILLRYVRYEKLWWVKQVVKLFDDMFSCFDTVYMSVTDIQTLQKRTKMMFILPFRFSVRD